jgi:hypothetical protein
LFCERRVELRLRQETFVDEQRPEGGPVGHSSLLRADRRFYRPLARSAVWNLTLSEILLLRHRNQARGGERSAGGAERTLGARA